MNLEFPQNVGNWTVTITQKSCFNSEELLFINKGKRMQFKMHLINSLQYSRNDPRKLPRILLGKTC
jgi:hypothetical protein